jgi:ADP-heptose:LPS heptosyltransferase
MKRYLIVKPSSLGDILHAMPAVSALAKTAPDVAVDWLHFDRTNDATRRSVGGDDVFA